MQNIGSRLRKLRKANNLTMSALAKNVGVSRSLISQVERDEAYPSLQTLSKLVEVLGVSMSQFFQTEPNTNSESNFIIRSGSHNVIFMPDSEIKYHILSPSNYRDMEFIITEFPPDKNGRPIDYFRHDGYEHFYVLQGELNLNIDGETYTIRENDSGCFDANKLHCFINKTDRVAKIIVAATEPDVHMLSTPKNL